MCLGKNTSVRHVRKCFSQISTYEITSRPMAKNVHTHATFVIKLTNENMSSQAIRRLSILQTANMSVTSVDFQHCTKPTWRFITRDTLMSSGLHVRFVRRDSTQTQSCRDTRTSTQMRSHISVTYAARHFSTNLTCGNTKEATTLERTQSITSAVCVVKTSHLKAH
jgi:hypothetical protein